METNACLELLGGYNLISPDTDTSIVDHFIGTLISNQILSRGSTKDLQPVVAAINECLGSGSQQGKLNGLLVLDQLIKECNPQMFIQIGPSYIQQLIQLVKLTNVNTIFFVPACDVLNTIIQFAPDFPDVSRHMTSMTANMVTTLIECAKANPSVAKVCARCISNLQKSYFGACLPVTKHIEKFILDNMTPWNSTLDRALVADCFALLPKAGGGGKDGIVHKEAWDQLAKKSLFTLDQLAENIFSVLPSFKKSQPNEDATFLDLPQVKSSMDLIRRSYFYADQFNILTDSLTRMFLSAFPHPKMFRPSIILKLTKKVLTSVSLANLTKSSINQESKILAAVLPQVLTSALKLLDATVKCCKDDLLIFIPDILTIVLGLVQDLRQCSSLENATIPFRSLREELYKFVSTLCHCLGANSGLEYISGALVPLLVSDFLPCKAGVKLTSGSNHKKNKNKQKPKKVVAANEGSELKGLPAKSTDTISAIVLSLNALADLFGACGTFLKKSLHKNVQLILIGLCLEVQLQTGCNTEVSGYSAPSSRQALYSALLKLVVNQHPRWPFPVQYALCIFSRGLVDEPSSQVREICRAALASCQIITHPRSACLDLELPIDQDEIASVKSESMKVHLVYINAGNNSIQDFNKISAADDSENDEDESMEVGLEENVQATNGKDYTQEPGYDLLSGKTNGKKRKPDDTLTPTTTPSNDATVDEELDEAECEKLMKDVNSFQNKVSIVIPDEVANRIIPDPKDANKKPRLELDQSDESDKDDQGPDLAEMLGSFVNK